jgi:hypothetical protein
MFLALRRPTVLPTATSHSQRYPKGLWVECASYSGADRGDCLEVEAVLFCSEWYLWRSLETP